MGRILSGRAWYWQEKPASEWPGITHESIGPSNVLPVLLSVSLDNLALIEPENFIQLGDDSVIITVLSTLLVQNKIHDLVFLFYF